LTLNKQKLFFKKSVIIFLFKTLKVVIMIKNNFIIKLSLFLILSFIYQYFLGDAPSLFLSENDSLWYAEKSKMIFNGEWLGEYNRLTLIKNSFFPIFLTLIHFFKIKYTTLILCFHHLAIFFFVNTFRPRNILVFSLLLVSAFFYPEFFTVYKGTIIREDLEVILILFFLGAVGRWFLYGDFKFGLVASLIAGIGLTNRDSGFTWSIPFYLILFYSLFDYVKKHKIFVKPFIASLSCLLILNLPSMIIKNLNQRYYGYDGKSLIYNSNFKLLYGKISSIRHKDDHPTVLGNPLSNQTIKEIRNKASAESDLKKLLDILEDKWGDYKVPSTTPDVIEGGKQWGIMFLWGLFYSVHDLYDPMLNLNKSPVSFQQACDKLISEIDQFCSLNSDFDCSVKNRGFIQHPQNWSAHSFIYEIFVNIPKFFSKYFYWTFGERQNALTLAPRNDDYGWASGREVEAFNMLKTLNQSKISYEKDRLTSSTLKKLQLFSYLIRYLVALIVVFVIFKRFSKNILRNNNSKFFLTALIMFCVSNGIYYIYYLILLKRGFKHLVITGSLIVPIMIILLHSLINFSEFDFKRIKK